MNLLPLSWGTIGRKQGEQRYAHHWRRSRTKTLCGLQVLRWRRAVGTRFSLQCQNCIRIMDAEERAANAGEQ